MVCVVARYDHGVLTIEAVRRKICQRYPGSRYLIVRIYNTYPCVYAVFECETTPNLGELNIVFEGEDDISVIYTCFVMDIFTTWEEGKAWRDRLYQKAADYVYKHDQ